MSVHDNRIKVTRKQDHQGRKVRLDLVRSNRWWVTERRQFTITEYQMLRALREAGYLVVSPDQR